MNAEGELALSAAGSGSGPLDYAWEHVDGPMGDLLAIGNEAVFYAPALVADAVIRLRVRVTDAHGISTATLVRISVAGTGAAPSQPTQATTTTTITDALGNVTTRVHDAQGRLISEQGPASRTDYTYDTDGNVSSVIEDAGGTAPAPRFSSTTLAAIARRVARRAATRCVASTAPPTSY